MQYHAIYYLYTHNRHDIHIIRRKETKENKEKQKKQLQLRKRTCEKRKVEETNVVPRRGGLGRNFE